MSHIIILHQPPPKRMLGCFLSGHGLFIALRGKKHWSKIEMKLWRWRLKRTMRTSEGEFAVFCCKAAFQKDSRCITIYFFQLKKKKCCKRWCSNLQCSKFFHFFPAKLCELFIVNRPTNFWKTVEETPARAEAAKVHFTALTEIFM